ncbi:MAG: hypothetical protein AB7P21_07145 [Lautropia sp.]
MFDSLYQTETDRALDFESKSPRPQPKAEPGVFAGAGSALFTGAAQGATQFGASVLDVLNEYGKAAALREGGAKEDTVDKMFTEQQPEAKALRAKAKSWEPDPETTGTAAKVLQGLGNVGAKIVGSVALGGPTAPALLGVSEGITEGTTLADKGVDASTAAKAGLVKGLTTAAGAALPIAGKTVEATAGLVLAGGPAMFMAERQAIGEILGAAGYEHLMAEYDPLDVTGLTMSLVAPAAFGAAAHAMRASTSAKAGAAKTIAPSEEAVDAARVSLLEVHEAGLMRAKAEAEGRPMTLDDLIADEKARADVLARLDDGEPVLALRQPAGEPVNPAALADGAAGGAALDAAIPVGASAKAPSVRANGAVDPTADPGLEAPSAAPARAPDGAPAPDATGGAPTRATTESPAFDHPDIAIARQRVAERDFEMQLEDGSVVKASEALLQAEERIRQGEIDAGAFRAAVNCFLGA